MCIRDSQRTIRERQLERAKKLLRLKDPEKIKKGQNKFCLLYTSPPKIGFNTGVSTST